MLSQTRQAFIKNNADILIMAAAVSDFTVKNYFQHKMSKKKTGEEFTLELVQNPDILKTMCEEKTQNQTAIGFCLSSENVLENAKEKLKTKGCEIIVANEAKTALGSDENEVWIIDKSQNIQKIEKTTKKNIAHAILEKLYD